jgi:hypothetical protein
MQPRHQSVVIQRTEAWPIVIDMNEIATEVIMEEAAETHVEPAELSLSVFNHTSSSDAHGADHMDVYNEFNEQHDREILGPSSLLEAETGWQPEVFPEKPEEPVEPPKVTGPRAADLLIRRPSVRPVVHQAPEPTVNISALEADLEALKRRKESRAEIKTNSARPSSAIISDSQPAFHERAIIEEEEESFGFDPEPAESFGFNPQPPQPIVKQRSSGSLKTAPPVSPDAANYDLPSRASLKRTDSARKSVQLPEVRVRPDKCTFLGNCQCISCRP